MNPKGRPAELADLTTKQADFVIEYIRSGGNGAEAALKAYETESYTTAASIATNNLKKPKIQQALDRFQDGDGVMDSRELLRFYTSMIRNPQLSVSQRKRAADSLARCLGLFSQTVQIEGGGEDLGVDAQVTSDDLAEMLQLATEQAEDAEAGHDADGPPAEDVPEGVEDA